MPKYLTVTGEIRKEDLGITLIHEHILVDFVGAALSGPDRYVRDEVVKRALPFLTDLVDLGCSTFVDCTPAYPGRDVQLLQQLSIQTGLNILTNTGYYGAVDGKYLPKFAFSESAGQLAQRWILEAEKGIDDTGIKPGFIKIGVNKGPLNAVDRKLVEAAAITHLATGLTISSHTGDGKAALEQIHILQANGVHADAFRWVHAQNEKDTLLHLEAAGQGAWVEFDGISEKSAEQHFEFISNMKSHNFLDHCLISQDSGWYHVGEENGGNYNDYNYIFDHFIPLLKHKDFEQKEIDLLLFDNVARSLGIYPRKN
ncbi:MAG: phosphotriesterase [Saprospiraceae bacterium]|nr:phosphotriesterase [Saprospiraceae bacterium]